MLDSHPLVDLPTVDLTPLPHPGPAAALAPRGYCGDCGRFRAVFRRDRADYPLSRRLCLACLAAIVHREGA